MTRQPTKEVEGELIAGLKRGDNESFEKLQQIYGAKLFAIACSHLGPYKEEACDVVQEVWIKVFEKISQFDGRSSLYTWIASITKNICFDRHRKFKSRRLNIMESIENVPTQFLLDGSKNQDWTTENQELKRLINKKLSLLDMGTRQMIIMRFYEERRTAEAAEVLNLRENTAKVVVFRGLAKLRKMMLRDPSLRSYTLVRV